MYISCILGWLKLLRDKWYHGFYDKPLTNKICVHSVYGGYLSHSIQIQGAITTDLMEGITVTVYKAKHVVVSVQLGVHGNTCVSSKI